MKTKLIQVYVQLERDYHRLKEQCKELEGLSARRTLTEKLMEALEAWYKERFSEPIQDDKFYIRQKQRMSNTTETD